MSDAGWQILDFTGFEGELRYLRGRIQIESKSGEIYQSAFLTGLAVILIGTNTTVSGAVLAKCSEKDIAVLVCDWRGVPVASVVPQIAHGRVGARHRAQATMTLPRRKRAWKTIVQAKILGQATNLDAHGHHSEASRVRALAKSTRSGDTDNCEAQAARLYWHAFGAQNGFVRNPGGGGDGWNSGLDYGYTILRGFGIRAVVSAGLCAPLGLFHRGRSNQFNLVDDLIEPFRPLVDSLVFSEIEFEEPLSKESKKIFAGIGELAFQKSGKTIPTLVTELAQSLGLYTENELEKLIVPTWNGAGYA